MNTLTNSLINGMNVLSLFDGMSCGRIALERAGIKVSKYFASEIDPHAIKVATTNYPDTIQIGDIRNVRCSDLPKIDLMIGGSPCQGFSFAGKLLNFDDPRSRLFFEYVRLLETVKPKYFLLENVKMKKESEAVITKYLGVEPVVINSSLVSAQNRVRLYWTNIPGLVQPEDRGITWGDVRERGVEAERYYYTEKALQWMERHGYRKQKVLKVHEDHEKMQMLEASHHKNYSSQRFFGILDNGIENGVQRQAIAAMRGRYIDDGNWKDGQGKTVQYIEFRNDGKSNCLTTVQKDNVVVPFEHYERVLAEDFAYRYITPLECERLQTVPDGYTDCVSNTQRYKMLGNGWTVDVISHIFKGIKEANTSGTTNSYSKTYPLSLQMPEMLLS
ncbi:DNA (cytosine-5-)-methyltransferase [Bacillus sp. 3255]|uniref:DNA (cytosine-5-)-methyltransferase n=1 Tax=Bacillus sp. 3255 TaxID=2817904 RepID=UPI0028657B47|nr:DNA (cytosine-5-)-methyltransferase [Bacillus sp. 3255]MDR6883055.1 DNA-cytosine methyltransferase [Bacillus sp. 3255]